MWVQNLKALSHEIQSDNVHCKVCTVPAPNGTSWQRSESSGSLPSQAYGLDVTIYLGVGDSVYESRAINKQIIDIKNRLNGLGFKNVNTDKTKKIVLEDMPPRYINSRVPYFDELLQLLNKYEIPITEEQLENGTLCVDDNCYIQFVSHAINKEYYDAIDHLPYSNTISFTIDHDFSDNIRAIDEIREIITNI